jgi:hypothetical protein
MQNGQVSLYCSNPLKRAHDANISVSDGAKRANNNGYFRNLMARDDFKNLGFAQSPPPPAEKAAPEAEKGVKE